MPVAVIRLAVLSLLIFAVSLATHAQSRASKSGVSPLPANGSVAGTIAAPGLTNISGIKITLHSTSGSTKDPSQTTGLDGSFVFYDIVPGTYAVDVDPTTLPQKYCLAIPATIQVRPGTRAVTEVTLEARRSLVGHAFVDLDGNGAYSPGKDTPIADAQIAVG